MKTDLTKQKTTSHKGGKFKKFNTKLSSKEKIYMNKITKKQKLDNLLNEFPLKKSLMTKEEAERNITVINNKNNFKLITKRKQNDRIKNKPRCTNKCNAVICLFIC